MSQGEVRALAEQDGVSTMSYRGDSRRRRYVDSAGVRSFLWDGQNTIRRSDDSGAHDPASSRR